MTPRKCNILDPSRRDVVEAGSVTASTTNGKRNTSACEWMRRQYHRTRTEMKAKQIGVENFVQNAWSPSRFSKLAKTIHPAVKPKTPRNKLTQ